jgi:hypothetical protein
MLHRHAGSGERALSRTYSVSELRRCLGERGIQLEHCYGIGLLCLNAQTRLASRSRFMGVLRSLARVEASVRPYIEISWLARHAAHVVAFAKRDAAAFRR